jgi:multidrug resistance efflux pump
MGVVRQTEIRIAPDTSGRLAAFRVAAGQEVRQGDVLAVLQAPELAAAVEEARANAESATADRANVLAGTRREEVDIAAQNVRIAQANLALAKQQHARAMTLSARDFASKQQLDESSAALGKAEADLGLMQAIYDQSRAGPTGEERAIAVAKVALARATVADLEAKLAKTTIRAPVDGRIGILVARPGEAISPGQPVMTLLANDERWFTFTIREDLLEGITIGQPLRLSTAGGDRIDTSVTELRPLGEFAVWRAARAVGDHDISSFLVRSDPVAPSDGLEAGMTVWLDR